jgi:hypothetical protein
MGNTKSGKVGTIGNNRKNIGKPIGKKLDVKITGFVRSLFLFV